MKGYPKYKESGVPWLGEVPEHWEIHRGKYLFKKMSRPVRAIDEVVTCFRDGTVTLRKNRRTRGFTESLKEIGYQGVRKGDLVIHQMDAFAGAIGVSDSDGKGTPVYSVCYPRTPLETKYYAHIVREMSRSEYILSLAKGIRERSTDFRFDTFGAQFLPMPPIDEQNQIACYLDWQTAKINRFIRNKKRLIALLREQRQNVINRAVTRGIDPEVKMKESGVEWLGEIPEHWEIAPLKRFCIIQNGLTLGALYLGKHLEKRPYLRVANVQNGYFALDSVKEIEIPQENICRYELKYGDVLITEGGDFDKLGRGFVWEEQIKGCLHQNHIFAVRPNQKMLVSQYLSAVLNARPGREYFTLKSKKTTNLASTNSTTVKNFIMPFITVEEQQQIVEHIEQETSIIDRTISRAEREIELIEEYCTRLISDVVTGRVDVRHIEVPDFEPVELESGETEDDEQELNVDEME